ncbi:MAG: hypothetical protein ACXU9W_08940 [Thermodesulfobacteriota bacterium]
MMNKLGNLTKSRKFYLLLCGVMLFSPFVQTQVANSAPPKGIAIETFTKIDFVVDKCWKFAVGTGNIQYTNICTVNSDVVVTLLDGTTQETFTVAPQGKLIFLGGSVVHIIKEEP